MNGSVNGFLNEWTGGGANQLEVLSGRELQWGTYKASEREEVVNELLDVCTV